MSALRNTKHEKQNTFSIVLSDILEVKYEIDLGAERTIAAYRGTEKVEKK